MGAEQDLGEGTEESEDVEGGGEDVEKTKQLQGRGREDGFSLIRREHEGELKQRTHTPSAPHPHPPEKKNSSHRFFHGLAVK